MVNLFFFFLSSRRDGTHWAPSATRNVHLLARLRWGEGKIDIILNNEVGLEQLIIPLPYLFPFHWQLNSVSYNQGNIPVALV